MGRLSGLCAPLDVVNVPLTPGEQLTERRLQGVNRRALNPQIRATQSPLECTARHAERPILARLAPDRHCRVEQKGSKKWGEFSRERVGGSPSVPATTLWVLKVLDNTGNLAHSATKANGSRRLPVTFHCEAALCKVSSCPVLQRSFVASNNASIPQLPAAPPISATLVLLKEAP